MKKYLTYYFAVMLLIFGIVGVVRAVQLSAAASGDFRTVFAGYTSADTAIIGDAYTVTIPVSELDTATIFMYSASPNYAKLIVNGKLVLAGKLLRSQFSNLTIGAGGILDMQTFNLHDSCAGTNSYIFHVDGTSGSSAKIYSAGSSKHTSAGGGNANERIVWKFADFYNMGQIGRTNNSTTDTIDIGNCTFTDCGTLTYSMWNNVKFKIDRSDFYGTGTYLMNFTDGTGTAGANIIRHCTFQSSTKAEIRYGFACDVDSNVFVNVHYQPIGTGYYLRNHGNLFIETTASNQIACGGDSLKWDSTYIYTNYDNEHSVAAQWQKSVFNGFVIEDFQAPGEAGDQFGVGDYKFTLQNSLLLSRRWGGSFVNIGSGGTGTGQKFFTNNTIYGKFAKLYGVIVNENGGYFADTVFILNNIFIHRDSATTKDTLIYGAAMFTPDTNMVHGEYNWWRGINDPYHKVEFKPAKTIWVDSGFGKHDDRTSDAAFFDTSRGMVKYDALYGSETGTEASAIAYWLNINGYDSATHAQANTPSAHNVLDLWSWVRGGFTPTNSATATAGMGGTYVGFTDSVVTVNASPHIDSIKNRIALRGTGFKVWGTNFGDSATGSSFYLNSLLCPLTMWKPDSIRAKVPIDAPAGLYNNPAIRSAVSGAAWDTSGHFRVSVPIIRRQ